MPSPVPSPSQPVPPAPSDDVSPRIADPPSEAPEEFQVPEVAQESAPVPDAQERAPSDDSPIESRVVQQRGRKTDIYVEKHRYQHVLLAVSDVQDDLREAMDHLGRVLDDEGVVSAKVDAWHDLLDDVQQNLIAIDMRLFGKGDDDG